MNIANFFYKNITKQKENNIEKTCVICLFSNYENFDIFLDYSNMTQYIKCCNCEPEIHVICFKNYVKLKNKCVICCENIYICDKSKYQKIIYFYKKFYFIVQFAFNIFFIYFFIYYIYSYLISISYLYF